MADITEIAVIPKDTALSVFTMPGMIDPYLAKIRAEIDAFESDVTTKKGREAIASFAYKIAKCKTQLDGVGKEQTDIQKEIPKKIDATRKHIRDTLDQWKDEVRQPLDEWEQAEQARQDRIAALMGELQGAIDDRTPRSSEAVLDRLNEIKAQPITEDIFQEHFVIAKRLHAQAMAALTEYHAEAVKREQDAAELEALRAERAERERKEAEERAARERAEREERIAKEAAERAARQAQEEVEAAACREKEAKARAEEAERRAAQAEKDAKERAEREHAAKLAAEQEAAQKREANKRHRMKINREALSALLETGISEDQGKSVIEAIAKGRVPHITINY